MELILFNTNTRIVIKKLIVKKNFILQSTIIRRNFIKLINGKSHKINIKNRTYYFFNDMINIEVFDSKFLKIDQNSCKNFGFTTLDTSQ